MGRPAYAYCSTILLFCTVHYCNGQYCAVMSDHVTWSTNESGQCALTTIHPDRQNIEITTWTGYAGSTGDEGSREENRVGSCNHIVSVAKVNICD
jgi:hypothetical protein